MEKASARAATLAGVAAVALILAHAPAFVGCPSLGAPRSDPGFRGAATPLAGATPMARAVVSSMPVLSLLSVMASGMLARRSAREGSRVATKAVIAKDAEGFFRFKVDGGSASEALTKYTGDSQVLWRPEQFFGIGAAATAATQGFSVANQPGVCAPYGEPGESYWDPAGFCNGIDEAQFRQYRQAELKHGRVCMTAMVGLLAQHTFRFNLVYPYDSFRTDVDFSSVPNGVAAMWSGPAAPWLGVLILVAGLHEVNFTDEGRDAGDFGDPLNFAKLYGLKSKSEKALFQTFELNHGRLAMTAVLGSVLAEYATGLDAVEQWSYAGAAFGRTLALTQPQGPVGPL